MKTPDWIHLLEASYELEHDDVAWRRRVLECAAPLFGPREKPLGLCVARATPTHVDVEILGFRGPSRVREQGLDVITAAPPRALDLLWRSGATVGSLSELVFSKLPHAPPLFFEASGGVARDAISVQGRIDSERTLAILSPRSEIATTTREERRRWHQAMCHVAAGLRLRRAAVACAGELDADATLDPSGRVHHADGAARSASARESLRVAVRNVEHARSSKGRRDPIEAMESWCGLVDGRWSLVDRFDSDGKRFVVAVRNAPDVLDPRGLSRREQQIAELVGLGRSTKEIAYELGLSLSAVSMTAGRARRKLGLGSRTELASFFAPAGMRGRLAETTLAGERVLVGAHPLLDPSTVERLSPAERSIATALLEGHTSAEIASRRRTSERTVANQIRSIFEKLGVASRVELAARLHATEPNATT